MTAQISDTLILDGDEYDITSLNGTKLPEPSDFGMVPTMISTACYHGFYQEYEVCDGRLCLKTMTMRENDDNYKPVNGVEPVVNDYAASYSNINLDCNYTGVMYIAKDFIQELYIHMGFQDPSSYKTVKMLKFKEGLLIEKNDLSEVIRKRQGEFVKKYEEMMERGETMEAIEESFRRDIEQD